MEAEKKENGHDDIGNHIYVTVVYSKPNSEDVT